MSDFRLINQSIREHFARNPKRLSQDEALSFLVNASEKEPLTQVFFSALYRQLTPLDPIRTPYSVMKIHYSRYLNLHAGRFGVAVSSKPQSKNRSQATEGVIYEIRHRRSGRAYIGESVGVKSRWKAHAKKLAEGKHHSSRLQYLYNCCGSDAFDYVVVEEIAVSNPDALHSDLENAERKHLLAAGARKLNSFFPGEGWLREIHTAAGSGIVDDIMNEITQRYPDRRLRPAQYRRLLGQIAGFDYSSPHPILLEWYRMWTGKHSLEDETGLRITVGTSVTKIPFPLLGVGHRPWVKSRGS